MSRPWELDRARQITRQMATIAQYISELSTERDQLVAKMVLAGWSQHEIAAELGISQPEVHRMVARGR